MASTESRVAIAELKHAVDALPSESGRRLTKGWRFEASDVTKDHPGRLTKFWGRIYDEQGRFVSHISEDAANELLNAAPQVAPMATRGVPGSSPGASIPAEAAPSDKPSASETPIRDAWHRPLGFDGLVRARFNQFLDDVIAPMERELARLRSAERPLVDLAWKHLQTRSKA